MAPNTRQGLSEENVRELLAEEVTRAVDEAVARAMNDMVPELVATIRDQLIEVIDERNAVNRGNQAPGGNFNYRDFSACKPPEFKGSVDPMESMTWLKDVEGAFLTCACPDNLRVRYVRNLLRGSAKNWWENWTTSANMTERQIAEITWGDFRTKFEEQFAPRVERVRIAREFLTLQQTTETIPEFNKKFLDMVLYCPDYAANEDMKMNRYRDMLRDDLGLALVNVHCTTLSALMEAARNLEIATERVDKKRKNVQSSTGVSSATKRSKVHDNRNQRNAGFARNAARGPIVCYKCGLEGHIGRDCGAGGTVKVCFNCGKPGHIRPDCPEPRREGSTRAIAAPNNPPLRITDGRSGPARPAPTTRARVHQMTAEAAQSTPAVVTGALLFRLYLFC